MASMKDILLKIGHFRFSDWDASRAVLTRDQFKKTLMDSFGPASEMAPIYESSRSCNEKWNDLINCGFAVRRNKNSIEFNIPQIKDFLEMDP